MLRGAHKKMMLGSGIRDILTGNPVYGRPRPNLFTAFPYDTDYDLTFTGLAMSGDGRIKLRGTGSWGNVSVISKQSKPRVSGRRVIFDYVPGSNCNGMIGFHDGAGHSYTDIAHGIYFYSTGSIGVFENGNFRGNVGSGFTPGTRYRVRITIGTTNAVYEIQGGAYPAIGGSTWTDVTPGTTSSSTDPVYFGASAELAVDSYLDNVGFW